MSRTRHGSKGPGYDFWSRRPFSSIWGHGTDTKRLCHRAERNQAKDIVRRELDLIETERQEDEWDELWDFSEFEWMFEGLPEEERADEFDRYKRSL